MNIWQELQVAPGSEVREIKLAYARRLKQVHPEDDAEGFQRLRRAYEQALLQTQGRRGPAPPAVPRPAAELRPGADAEVTPPRPPRQAPAPPAPPEAEPAATQPVQPVPVPLPSDPPPGPAPIAVAPLRVPPRRGMPLPVPPPLDASERLAAPQPRLLDTPQPAQAAHLLFEQLKAATAAQWPALLAASRRTPGWENLDFQTALEQAVIAGLSRRFVELHALVEAFARHYGWQGNRLQMHADDGRIVTLLARAKARRRRLDIQTNRAATTAPWRAAFELLLGPKDEPAFRRHARWDGRLRAMRQLLAHLHKNDTEVLTHELDPASLQWWMAFLETRPVTWTRRIGLVIVGFALMLMVLAQIADADIMKPRWLRIALMPLLLALPSLLDLGLRRLRHHGWPRRAQAARERWRHETRPRRIAWGLTALFLLLGIGAWSIPGFWIFPLLSVLMLWFWTSLGFALASAVALAWPLQVPLSLLVAGANELWPKLGGHFDTDALVIGFPHWPAMFLVKPFNQLCAAVYAKLYRKPPADPIKLGWFSALGLLFAGFLLAVWTGLIGADSGGPAPPVPPRRPIQAAAAPKAPSSYVEKAAMAPPAPRDDRQIHQTYLRYSKQFQALFAEYGRPEPGTRRKEIVLELTVAPSGEVTDGRVTESTFRNPLFEQRLLALARRQKFDPLPGGAAQKVVYSWGKPIPAIRNK